MITHRAAQNTIADVNARFHVTETDAVLGLSRLSFDLSVWDIFGVLGAGGRLVLPRGGRAADPSEWAALLADRGITILNAVPAEAQMLADYLGMQAGDRARNGALRLVLMSGDWIPVTLPDLLRRVAPGAQLVSLGGATEASIWSIYHPIDQVDADATSIPYGSPLTNQTVHVLDDEMRPCPDWTVGELYIGGAGVALGYLGDEQRTSERFVVEPGTGGRLYRTGDLGFHRPTGEIELVGREDLQVKVRGYRIDLREVEASLLRCPGVAKAVAVVVGDDHRRTRIGAIVVPVDGLRAPEAGAVIDALRAQLPDYMVPSQIAFDDALPVTANGKVDRSAVVARLATDEGDAAAVEHDAPVGDVEATIATAWRAVLDVESIGRHDDFFGLGGNSLLASNAVLETMTALPAAMELGFDRLLVGLLNSPTVAGFAQEILDTPAPAASGRVRARRSRWAPRNRGS